MLAGLRFIESSPGRKPPPCLLLSPRLALRAVLVPRTLPPPCPQLRWSLATPQPPPSTSAWCWGLAGRGSGRSEEVLSLAQARWKPAAFPALEMPCERRKTCCFSALMLCEGNIPALLPQEKKIFLVPLLSG